MSPADDILRIAPATHGPDGQKIEPEEAPAQLSHPTTAPLTFNDGTPVTVNGVAIALPGSFDFESTAGEIADAMRHKCSTCKYFDVPRWRLMRRRLEVSSNMEERIYVNNVRASIEQFLPMDERDKHHDALTGELDTEHALDAFGLCNAQTEIKSKEEHELHPVLVLGNCGCPDEKSMTGIDLSKLYKPRDRAADRDAARSFDKVLAMAQGRGVTK